MTEQVKGLKDLERKLNKLQHNVRGKALRNATNQAMLPVLRSARTYAPVGTEPHKTYKGRWVFPGHLQRSVRRRSRLSRDKNAAYSMVGVKPEAFYGVQFVEIGTKYISGNKHKWLRPAMQDNQRAILRLLKEKLKHQIDKARR